MTEPLDESRRRLRSRLGSELADKATDEFVLALSRSLRRVPGDPDLETLATEVPASPATVVEFDPRTDLTRRVEEETVARRTEAGGSGGTRLEELGRAADRLDAPTDLASRDASVRALREDFHRTCGGVTDTLERSGGARLRAGMEAFGSGGPTPITYTCWLNRTVRTAADPTTIAEVAGEQAITRIDVPRRIQAEVTKGANTVGAPAFRQATGTSGAGVVVGVIDTEVMLGHPALSDRVIHRRNYTEEPWGNPGDHGTAVAGIAAADGAIVGIAPEAVVYNYKILATSPFFDADDFFGARAIQDALEDGAHVVNCSWGTGPAGDGTSREVVACDTAWSLGLVIVKSAGNRGPGAGTLTTPAEAAGVIAVGATDRDGTAVQDYSSRGPAPSGEHRPHLVAPGGADADQILSLLVDCGLGTVGWGTSFAAPHVTGLVALLLGETPGASPDDLRNRLIGSCQPISGFLQDEQGAGPVHLVHTPALAHS